MPADGCHTAREACGLDLETATFLEVGAHGGHWPMEPDSSVATLADESGVRRYIERRQGQVLPVDSTLRDIITRPVRVQPHESLQRRDAQFLSVNPTEHLLGFNDPLERGRRFRRVNTTEGLDGLHLQIGPAARRQVAINDGE